MKRVYVVTEGHSETNFVKRVLSEYFNGDIILIPTTVLTKSDPKHGRMHKGGFMNYEKTLTTIRKDLAYTREPDVYVTTMFDFYALPANTPGVEEAKQISDPYEKVRHIEEKMAAKENLDKPVFRPYIQLHEFEALLFAEISRLGEEYFEYDITELEKCLEEIRNPELIDDGEETAPSKRILRCIPDYDKATSGVSVLEKIGVDTLYKKCRHFAEWIDWFKSFQ